MKDAIVTNKKATFLYQIIKKYEAGISLLGWEVKSLRNKKVDISSSYIKIKNLEALSYFTIEPLKTVTYTVAQKRVRKLLLQKNQIIKISNIIGENKNLSLIPCSLYWKNNFIKLEFALAKPKKIYDKRQDIKSKQEQRNRLKDNAICKYSRTRSR